MERSDLNSSVSLVMDYKIQLNLFAPVIRELKRQNITINLYCPKSLNAFITKNIETQNNLKLLNLDQLKNKYKFLSFLHKFLREIFTKSNFSFQYSMRPVELRQSNEFDNIKYVLIRNLAKISPKVKNHSINKFLSTCLELVSPKKIFKDKIVITSSLNSVPYLLSAKDNEIITFMESWDHAVKVPNGYVSDIVFGWNKDLCEDWAKYQNDKNTKVFYPAKLQPATSYNQTDNIKKTKIVYSVATTKRFSNKDYFDIEHKIISHLARLTSKLGLKLILKLRPNGSTEDFIDIRRKFDHISITSLAESNVNIAPNYFLSKEYNFKRFNEISDASLIINAFTTFGLDAALAGFNVLQLDLRNLKGFEESSLIFNRFHIKKYLLGLSHTCKPNKNFDEIAVDLLDLSSSKQYSKLLLKWIDFPKDTNETVRMAVSSIFQRKN